MKNASAVVKMYLSQGEQYLSEHRDAMVNIADMHPTYAANAARKLLIDSATWATDAGQEAKEAARWILGTPLFRALQARATGSIKSVAQYRCLAGSCSFATVSFVRAYGHQVSTHHAMTNLPE